MISLVCLEPGRLAYQDGPPPAPLAGHALIRIRRIGVCGTDLHAFEGTQPFFDYPRILGHELAGELIDTGGAAGFVAGEAVTLLPYFNCGDCVACRAGKTNCCTSLRVSGVHIDGGMTELLSVPASALVASRGLSYDGLALVEPLAIGAHGVRRAAVQPGEQVLVVGAGPIGLGIMAFARQAGARVIALDVNEDRLAYCREHLNVSATLNARHEDTLAQLLALTEGDMPTVVFDATGNLQAINKAFSYLAHGGRYVLVGLQKGTISLSHPEFHKREATLMSSRNATRADFDHVITSLGQGLIDPDTFITHRVPFDRAGACFADWLDPASKVIKAMIVLP